MAEAYRRHPTRSVGAVPSRRNCNCSGSTLRVIMPQHGATLVVSRWSKRLFGRRQAEQPGQSILEKRPRADSIRCHITSSRLWRSFCSAHCAAEGARRGSSNILRVMAASTCRCK